MFRWIFLALAIAISAAASWQLQAGNVDRAVHLIEAVVVLVVAVVLEADKAIGGAWAGLQGARKQWQERPKALAPRPRTSAVSGASRPALTAATRPARSRAATVAPAVPRRPLMSYIPSLPETVAVPWMTVLAAAIGLAIVGQYYILIAGSLLKGLAVDGLGLGLALAWFQRNSDSFELRLLSTLPQFIGAAVLALALWFYGGYLIWHENETATYIGAALTWLGTGIGAWACLRFIEAPLAATERALGGEQEALTLYDLPSAGHDWISALRFPLLGVCLLLLLAMSAVTTYVVSLGLMVAAIAVFLFGSPFLLERWQDQPRPGLGWGLLGLGTLAVAAGFHAQGLIARGQVNPGLWWFLAAAIVLAVIMRRPEEQGPQRAGFSEKAGLVLLVLVAFFMRFTNVSEFPYGVEGDEAGYGIVFYAMQHTPKLIQNYFRMNNIGVALYWLGAFWEKVLGISVLSLRLASVCYGTFSILTFYFMTRLVLRWQAALLAAVALTVSTWHLHFSRFGHLNISQVFVQSACFYFFWKGMLSKRLRYFAVGGLCLGLVFMAHTAGKLVPFFFIGFILYMAVVHAKALARRSAGILVFFLFAWATIAPVMTYYIKFPLQGTGRIKEVSIMNNQNSNAPADAIAGAATNFRVSMLMFNYNGDSRSRDNALAPSPMLDYWSGVFFLLGLGFALYHWKKPFYAFMLLSFMGTLSASIISVEAPQSLRTAGNIPIVYFFIAVFFDRLLDLGRRAWAAMGEKLVILALVLALGFMANSNMRRFFSNVNYGWDLLPTKIGMFAGSLGTQYDVRFFSENFGGGHPPVTLFANNTPIRNHGELLECLPLRGNKSKGIGLAFSDQYQVRHAYDYVAWLYPQATVGKILHKNGDNIYDTFVLTPQQVGELYGWQGETKMGGLSQPSVLADSDFPQGVSPSANGPVEGHWKGTLFIPDWASQRFLFTGKGTARLKLDGREVAHSGLPGAWLRLPIGPHDVELSYRGDAKAPFQWVWERKVTESGGRYWALGNDSKAVPIPNDLMLRAIPQAGLTQFFYAGAKFEGPYSAKIDAVPFARWIDGPIGGSFSCEWRGKLKIETEGDYSFNMNGGSFGQVEVGGKLVNRRGKADFPLDARVPVASIHLKPGVYPIKARYVMVSQIYFDLTWKSPESGDKVVIIPPRLLQPELVF